MSKASNYKVLIATWTPEQDPCDDMPAKVVWEGGSTATLEDYLTHSLGTHMFSSGEDGGMQCHMYLGVVADVRYRKYGWEVSGNCIETFFLNLPDSNATDAQIMMELGTFPLVFSAIIHRE